MSIHLEAVITASPGQIYEYLTNGEMFTAATEQPARVSDREGEPFSLFGGRVEGRQIELVPRFVIDHNGIPPGWQDHIRTGYPTFYESPLTSYFGG